MFVPIGYVAWAWRRVAAVVAVVVCAGSVSGQVSIHSLDPVDQAIEDLDPLAVSLRVREPGLSMLGQGSSLFEIPSGMLDQGAGAGATNRRYYRIGSGYVARVSRIDYAIPIDRRRFIVNQQPVKDGQFIELVPPDTVFELTPIVGSEDLAVEPPREEGFWFGQAPLPTIYDRPVELGIWQRPLWRKLDRQDDDGLTERGMDEGRGDESAAGRGGQSVFSRDLGASLLSQPMGRPLDTRVTSQGGMGRWPMLQPVTPVDLRPMLRRQAEIRREREEAEKEKEIAQAPETGEGDAGGN